MEYEAGGARGFSNDIFAYGVNLIFLYLTLTQTSYIIFVFYYPDHSY